MPNNSPLLYARKRLVTSPFGLLGTDENALSFALAFTFRECPQLLQWFLGEIGISGVRLASLAKCRIDLQRTRTNATEPGVTDIEIHLPGRSHVIVEAKVGLAIPSIDQCQKYLPRLIANNEPTQRVVALVQSPDRSFLKSYACRELAFQTRLVGFNWVEFFPECVRLMTSNRISNSSQEWVRHFYEFLDQQYAMKAFTTEVWILPIDTKPLWPNGMSFWDIHQKYHVYFDYTYRAVRPLYLGLRVNGKVNSIHRVNRIEHGVPIIDIAPELKSVNADWPRNPHTIWHFDPPVNLPHPIVTGGGMFARKVWCDLDLLLSCKSVIEVEKAMRNRNDEVRE